MPYTAEISRKNPTCIFFLVDQSGSMGDPFGIDSGKSKAEGVADAINRLLQTLILRCAKPSGVFDFFHIGVLGYGEQVGSILGGTLTNRALVPISELADNPLRVEDRVRRVSDGAGGLVEESFIMPVWIDATNGKQTPMCRALHETRVILEEFIAQHPTAFPPIVMNLTDGDATDGDPEPYALAIQDLTTSDGSVLLFNLHMSSSNAKPIWFPESEAGLPDESAQCLFRMSSLLPPEFEGAAWEKRIRVTPQSRGFVFNADLVTVIQFLDIGTKVGQNAPGKPGVGGGRP